MLLSDLLPLVNYKISSGSEYCWDSYGPNAWSLDFNAISSVFDRETQQIYEVCVHGAKDICFKWVDPNEIAQHVKESMDRGFDPWTAYDNVKYQQITSDRDILEIISKMLT